MRAMSMAGTIGTIGPCTRIAGKLHEQGSLHHRQCDIAAKAKSLHRSSIHQGQYLFRSKRLIIGTFIQRIPVFSIKVCNDFLGCHDDLQPRATRHVCWKGHYGTSVSPCALRKPASTWHASSFVPFCFRQGKIFQYSDRQHRCGPVLNLTSAAECFFFGPVIVRASLAAKAADIIQGLVAIPACPLRFERGRVAPQYDIGRTVLGRMVANLVCIIHDSVPGSKAQHNRSAHSNAQTGLRGLHGSPLFSPHARRER